MKNVVLKVALDLSLANAAALAQGAFIGIEKDCSFNSKLTAKSDNGKSKVKKARPGIGLKAGYDFDSFKVYGAYIYDFQAKKSLGDEDDTVIKWSTHKFLVGADYTPELTKDIKLVFGGYTGYSKLKMDVFDTHDGSEKANTNGWILGARIGTEYSINKNNAVEFGLKADRTKCCSIAKYDNTKIKETNVGLYLGYTYKF